MQEQPTSPPLATFERDPNFESRYANNLRYESTVYDLKIVFGETDLSGPSEVVRQHTAVTIPWAAVKVAIYFLQANMALHELANGAVHVPPTQIPAEYPDQPFPGVSPELHKKSKDVLDKLRAEFIRDNG
jgi:hypothetical protein